MSYEVVEIEREDEHGDRFGVDDTEISYAEMLAKVEAIQEEETREALLAQLVEQAKADMVKVICSCGSFSCGAITTFGHPVPLYQAEIEPLSSQYSKDCRAVALKGGS